MKAWKFLCKFEDNLKQFMCQPSKIVLDIGSNDCQNFPFLFHFHGFEKYVGIDKCSEFQIFQEGNADLSDIEEYYRDYQSKNVFDQQINSFFTLYENVCSGFYDLKFQLSKPIFNKHLSFIKKEINERTNFRKLIKDNIDLIILSDFLHLFNKSKALTIFRNSISILKDSGFAYLTIPNEEYTQERKRKGSINIKWGIKRSKVEEFISPLNILIIDESENRINLLCGRNN
ncbi:unnamed protein product, partial [marine sediment metagenome]